MPGWGVDGLPHGLVRHVGTLADDRQHAAHACPAYFRGLTGAVGNGQWYDDDEMSQHGTAQLATVQHTVPN